MGEAFTLRGYAVERRIGRGASGDVWRARVAGSGAPVALKRIWTADAETRRRACTEAAVLQALDHPNLIRLHAVVRTTEALVLVLDLADGGSLAQLLAARGRLAPGEVITAVAPVAAALAYLHEGGVIHGDASPGNVLFTAGGVPLLADVGVARLFGDDTIARATPAYVDPTVAAGHLPGPPSDVFMLAGVALHALTGEPPWPGDADTALAHAAAGELAGVPERLAAARVSRAMTDVLVRALDPDPARRGTAADLALDLRHSGRPVAVELAAGRRPDPAALPWTGPRHALRASGTDAPDPADEDAARPAFVRPGAGDAGGEGGAEPPTRVVGSRPRPVIAPLPRRGFGGRRLAVVAGAVAAALVAAGGIAWAAVIRTDAHPTRARGEVETRTTSAGPGSASGSAAPVAPALRTTPAARSSAVVSLVASAPAPEPSPAPGSPWTRALVQLDARRAAAFATRDPDRLRDVYAAAGLLTADAALLRRLVPAGCGLPGVRTRYADVVVRAAGDRATLQVTAALPPSQLVCRGRVHASVPGAGPTRLRIVLVRTAAGPRIAAQTLVQAGGSG